MICSLSQIREKEVVNVEDGEKLGFIDDIEFDRDTGRITSFVIFGRKRFCGLFGKEKDIVITCDRIRLIGKDTVLITTENENSANSINSKVFKIDNLYRNTK